MSDLIYKMKNSTPTLIGELAEKVVIEAFLSEDKFVFFHSKIIGMDVITQIAEVFIASLAAVDLHELGLVNSIEPIHVLHFIPSKNNTKEYWGLLYSNCLIIYGWTKDDISSEHFMIFMEKKIAHEQGFESQKVTLISE